jgi:hypothetical protein
MLVDDPSRSTFCKRRFFSAAAKHNMDQLETWLCTCWVHAGSSAHWASLRNRTRTSVNDGLRMIARAWFLFEQVVLFTLAGATALQAPRVISQRKKTPCTQTNQIIAKCPNPARERQSSLQFKPLRSLDAAAICCGYCDRPQPTLQQPSRQQRRTSKPGRRLTP